VLPLDVPISELTVDVAEATRMSSIGDLDKVTNGPPKREIALDRNICLKDVEFHGDLSLYFYVTNVV
jgi:hypothetical protein